MQAEELTEIITEALDDLKAVNTVTLPVAGLTDLSRTSCCTKSSTMRVASM